jgi:predicted Zn finger-like uncharacterized protein
MCPKDDFDDLDEMEKYNLEEVEGEELEEGYAECPSCGAVIRVDDCAIDDDRSVICSACGEKIRP